MRKVINAVKNSAKIARPKIPLAYNRQVIFEKLRTNSENPIVWVEGSAGSGKSLLVNSFLESENIPCVWYQIDESDADIATFFHYLLSGLEKSLPESETSQQLLSLPYKPQYATFSKRFFQELQESIDSPLAIVFDDYHLIPENASFHEDFVEGLMQIQKAGIHIYVISRHAVNSQFVRLRAKRSLGVINNEDLAWNHSEIKSLAKLLTRNTLNDSILQDIVNLTQGWVSGVILLFELLKSKTISDKKIDSQDKSILFDYFASEIFEKTDAELQTFLLKSAYLKEIDCENTLYLLPDGNSKNVLKELCDKNYFITESVEEKNIYFYHPLFREFLINKSKQLFSHDELLNLKSGLALELASNKKIDRAIELYIEAEDWMGAAKIIERYAENYLNEGRSILLLEWINKIPVYVLNYYPWLVYWQAHCELGVDQESSYRHFTNAYDLFRREKNTTAEIHCICGIFESILLSWRAFDRVKPWIKTVTASFREANLSENIELCARLSSNMHTAILFCEPTHPDLLEWEKRVSHDMKLLEVDANSEHQVLVGINLFYQYLWQGDKAKVEKILDKIYESSFEKNNNPVGKIGWYLMSSIDSWMAGRSDQAKEAADKGLVIAEQTGIFYWNFLLLVQKGFACLIGRDLKSAEIIRKELLSQLNMEAQLHAALYFDFVARLEYLKGDFDNAIQYAEICLKTNASLTFPFASPGFRTTYAEILIAVEKFYEAEIQLENARIESQSINCNLYLYRCFILETELALKQDLPNRAKEKIVHAFDLAKDYGFIYYPGWDSEKMVGFFQFALQHRIEVEHVIDQIKISGLESRMDLIEFDNWPWSIKIYTLGTFKVIHDGRVLNSSTKAIGKPFLLLKAIISSGIWRVGQDAISTLLWSDSEGDEAQQALYTTVHRLRKILGSNKSIVFKDGYVGLNPDYVWVDIAAVQHFLGKISWCLNQAHDDRALLFNIDEMLRLYKGHYLESESQDASNYRFQKNIKQKVLMAIKLSLSRFIENASWHEALMIADRAILLDELDEDLYRIKIDILINMGKKAHAIQAYQDCRKTLSSLLGVMPSEETTAMINKLTPGEIVTGMV